MTSSDLNRESRLSIAAFNQAIDDEIGNFSGYIPPIEQRRVSQILTHSPSLSASEAIYFTINHGVDPSLTVDKPIPHYFTSDEVIKALVASTHNRGSLMVRKRIIGKDEDGELNTFFGDVQVTPEIDASFGEAYPNHALGVVATRLSQVEIDFMSALQTPAQIPDEEEASHPPTWIAKAAIVPRVLLQPMDTIDVIVSSDPAHLPNEFIRQVFTGRELFTNDSGELQFRARDTRLTNSSTFANALKVLRAHDRMLQEQHSDGGAPETIFNNSRGSSHEVIFARLCRLIQDGLQHSPRASEVLNTFQGQTLLQISDLQEKQTDRESQKIPTIAASLVSDELLINLAIAYFKDGQGPEKIAYGLADTDGEGDLVDFIVFKTGTTTLLTVFASKMDGKSWISYIDMSTEDAEQHDEVITMLREGIK